MTTTPLCVVLALAAPAFAASVPAIDWSGDTEQTYTDGPFTIGYRFRVNPASDIVVTSLGAYDMGRDGLAASHQVAIWRVDGFRLFRTTVPGGTAADLVGHFRYVPITPTTLLAGQEYVVAAANYGEGYDPYCWDPTTISISPDITYLHSRDRFGSTEVIPFPTGEQNFATYGYFGGSFQYEIVPAPGGVGLVLAGVALATRRRR